MAKTLTFLKGNLCIFKCFLDVLEIFLFGAKEKFQNVPRFEMDFVLNFAMCSADFNCVNGSTIEIVFSELFGFEVKIFKKRLLCLLFWVCSFVDLAQNTIVTATSKLNLSLNASDIHYTHHLLRRCQFRFWTLFDTRLINFIRKYLLPFIPDC